MSKAEGKKIAIKFTMPLLGDVTGNVAAFSVTGKEYQYINGPIINKSYTVESVERAPASLFYQEAFNGVSDGVEIGTGGLNLILPAFSPTDIAGLQLWLDASQITGLVDNEPVTTWVDASGNNRNAASSGTSRPLYKTNVLNGKPVLRFDGANDYMATPNVLNTDIHTIFVIAKANGTEEDIIGSGSLISGDILIMRFTNLFRGHFWTNNSPNAVDSVGTETAAWTLYNQEVNSAQIITRRNGIQDNAANIVGTKQGVTRPIIVGNRTGVYSGGFLNGDVAEVIVYNTALSTENRQLLETYLMTKYGIGGA